MRVDLKTYGLRPRLWLLNPSNVFRLHTTGLNVLWDRKLKLGNIRVIFPNLQNCACYEKYLKDNKHNSLHLVRKYARRFVLGDNLFLQAQNFHRATLPENCLLLGTDNVRKQIFVHIFALNGGYCLFILRSTNKSTVRVIFWPWAFFIFSLV